MHAQWRMHFWAALSTGVYQSDRVIHLSYCQSYVMRLYPKRNHWNLLKLIGDFFYFYESACHCLTFCRAFNQNVFHYHFIFPIWEGSIQTLFSTTALLFCQLLKKWNLQLLGRTYQRRQVWPWLSLPKWHLLSPKLYSCHDTKLELFLLTLVKTGDLLPTWQRQFANSTTKHNVQ